MDLVIDYTLYAEGNVLLDKKNIPAKHKKDDSLSFDDNYIDLKNKKYKRHTNEYEMTIDFNSNICTIKYSDLDPIEFKIESKLLISKNEIIIKYNFSDGEKKIIVKMKEVK